jgi:hypothetical protein
MKTTSKVSSKRTNKLKVQRIQLIKRDDEGQPLKQKITVIDKRTNLPKTVEVNIPIKGKFKYIKHKIV